MTDGPADRSVSVIIPAFGRSETVSRAIESVLAQIGIDPEIIVVDDHSPRPIELGSRARDVRIIRSEVNAGAGPARNLGAAHASHGVLAFLDADDEWTPGSARTRMRVLEPGVCVVGQAWQVNDLTGSSKLAAVPRDPDVALRLRNPLSPSSIVISRADFELVGGFPDDRDCAEDWVFFLRAVRAGIRICAVSKPVCVRHIDWANTTIDPDTMACHAVGAVRLMESEQLVSARDLVRARRVVSARVAGFYANHARWGASMASLRGALPGVWDLPVLRELLRVPLQAVRGAARRRWRGPRGVPVSRR